MDDKKILEQYVDGLLKEKNNSNVTDANREEVRQMLLTEVVDAINKKMLSLLTDEQIEELNKLMADPNTKDEMITKYFTDRIPNQSEVVTHVLLEFRAGYLSVVPADDGKPSALPPMPPETKKMN